PRPADRRRCAAGGAGLRPGRPCHAGRVPAGAAAAGPSVLGASAGDGDAACRGGHAAVLLLPRHRRERAAGRGRGAVPASGRPGTGVLNMGDSFPPVILRPSERPVVQRGGGVTTIPLVTRACGSTGLINGITIFPPGGSIAL